MYSYTDWLCKQVPGSYSLKENWFSYHTESLVEIFSRIECPKELLLGRETQFRHDMMAEVNGLLSFQALYTTLYYPSFNGAVEKL